MAASARTAPDIHAIPILLGVTGHRDTREGDREALSRAVRNLVQEVRAAAPRTPIIVMSSLAEGADQLAARAAIEAGARLWVPLPLEPEEYRKDFSPTAVAAFNELLSQADSVIPLGLAPGNTAVGVQDSGPQRRAQYALASAWILRRCHVLIALWDGSGPAKLGGTACTVGWRLEGLPESPEGSAPPRSALDVTDAGAVWQVVTPRKGSASELQACGTVVRKYPGASDNDEAAGNRLMQTFRRINAVNAEVAGADAKLQATIADKRGSLIDAAVLDTLPIAIRSAGERYARADALALTHQDQTRIAVPWVFGAAFVSILCLALFAHVYPGNSWWLSGYVLAFLAGFAALSLARHRAHEQSHVDYRALAEAMRVQFFWRLAGSRGWAADSHLRIHRSELDWVREALRGWSAAPEDAAPGVAGAARWEFVRERWVGDQHKWFAVKARTRHISFARCRFFAFVLLWAGFGAAVVMLGLLLLDVGRGNQQGGHDVPEYVHWLIVSSAMLMLVGGLVRAYAEKLAFESEANRYRLMTPIFERADRKLGALLDTGRYDDALHLVEELGREALAENAEWLLARREHRLEHVTGG